MLVLETPRTTPLLPTLKKVLCREPMALQLRFGLRGTRPSSNNATSDALSASNFSNRFSTQSMNPLHLQSAIISVWLFVCSSFFQLSRGSNLDAFSRTIVMTLFWHVAVSFGLGRALVSSVFNAARVAWTLRTFVVLTLRKLLHRPRLEPPWAVGKVLLACFELVHLFDLGRGSRKIWTTHLELGLNSIPCVP